MSSVCVCHPKYFMQMFFFFKQKTAYERRISDWSSDVCSSDLAAGATADGDTGDFEQRRPPAEDRRVRPMHAILGRGWIEGAERDIIGPRLPDRKSVV